MDPKVKEALLVNRIKILKFCDYFIVTAPLISRKILPMEKHKEFKNRVGLGPQLDLKAANNARLDSLLEYLDECSTPGAFEAFLEGVKECEGQKNLAKVLKKMAEGGKPKPPRSVDPNKPKKTPVKRPAPTTPSGVPVSGSPSIMRFGNPPPPSTFSGPSAFALPSSYFTAVQAQAPGSGLPPPTAAAAASPAPKKPKKEKGAKKNLLQNGPIGIGVIAPTLLPPVTTASPGAPSASETAKGKGKQNQTPKPKAPKKTAAKNQLNGQTGGVILKVDGNASSAAPPKKAPAAAKKKPGTSKIVLPKTTLPLTGIFFPNANTGGGVSGSSTAKSPGPATSTAKASTPSASTPAAAKSAAAAAAASAKKPFVPRVPAGSPFRRRATNSSKLKKMSFREVEEKQKSATRATTFSFVNPSAVVKTIHFNNKSDLFYEGCPTKTNNQLCAKKVQLKGKGKKYVCKDKHENESYELFPRLYVTFQDETTHMQTTLYRENVEVLAGKPVPDIHKMDDDALKGEFLKAHYKNIPIEVKCKKILKKEIKKAGGATWDNVATIITEDDGPTPAKRSRKSTD